MSTSKKSKGKVFSKCWGCYYNDTHKEEAEELKIPLHEKSSERLPRKKKKELIKTYKLLHGLTYSLNDDWGCYCYCSLASNYRDLKGSIKKYKFYKKYVDLINLIREHDDYEFTFFIDSKTGRLVWYWELDDDFCPRSGVMPLVYNEKDAGKTWAFSEVKSLVHSFLGELVNTKYDYYGDLSDEEYEKLLDVPFPENVVSDKTLLKHLDKLNKETINFNKKNKRNI